MLDPIAQGPEDHVGVVGEGVAGAGGEPAAVPVLLVCLFFSIYMFFFQNVVSWCGWIGCACVFWVCVGASRGAGPKFYSSIWMRCEFIWLGRVERGGRDGTWRRGPFRGAWALGCVYVHIHIHIPQAFAANPSGTASRRGRCRPRLARRPGPSKTGRPRR